MFEDDMKWIATQQVMEHIDWEVLLQLRTLILELTIEKDYLQIFYITKVDDEMIQIEHVQEIPEYRQFHLFKYKGLRNRTEIFIIDDDESITIMLADEY